MIVGQNHGTKTQARQQQQPFESQGDRYLLSGRRRSHDKTNINISASKVGPATHVHQAHPKAISAFQLFLSKAWVYVGAETTKQQAPTTSMWGLPPSSSGQDSLWWLRQLWGTSVSVRSMWDRPLPRMSRQSLHGREWWSRILSWM